MTPVQLDTGFLIRALVRGSPEDDSLRTWLAGDTPIAMSAVAWAEFLCGPLADADKSAARRLVGPPVPLEEADAEVASSMFNRGGRRRGTFVDCLIAAAAARAGARLATTNPADFRRFVDSSLDIVTDHRVPVPSRT
jgi:predicted nucleic acid-binding protein